jgi:uncharacterized protein
MISQRTIRAMARKIGQEFHPRQVVLFGSYARGEATEDSDVDLLVVMDQVGPRGRRTAPIRLMLAEEYVLPVDIVVQSDDAVQKWKDVPGSFTQRVFQEGIVLYEGHR